MSPKARPTRGSLLPVLGAFLLFFAAATVCSGEEFSAREIMRQMENRIRGRTNRGTMQMVVNTPNWRRDLTLKFWVAGDDRSLVKIMAPAKEAGIASLRIGSNMWNYLPKVERTVKIPASMMMQSWMGGDFTNDDVMKATSFVSDYEHRVLKTETVDGQQIWLVESVPRPGTAVVWGKVLLRIGPDYLPRREEFCDEKGRAVKVLEFSDFKIIGGRKFPGTWKMTPLNKKGCDTTLKYLEIEFDASIPEKVFSLANLKK